MRRLFLDLSPFSLCFFSSFLCAFGLMLSVQTESLSVIVMYCQRLLVCYSRLIFCIYISLRGVFLFFFDLEASVFHS